MTSSSIRGEYLDSDHRKGKQLHITHIVYVFRDLFIPCATVDPVALFELANDSELLRHPQHCHRSVPERRPKSAIGQWLLRLAPVARAEQAAPYGVRAGSSGLSMGLTVRSRPFRDSSPSPSLARRPPGRPGPG